MKILFTYEMIQYLPLYKLWALCAEHDITDCRKSSDVDCLLAKAEVPEEQSDDQAVSMANARCCLRWMQV